MTRRGGSRRTTPNSNWVNEAKAYRAAFGAQGSQLLAECPGPARGARRSRTAGDQRPRSTRVCGGPGSSHLTTSRCFNGSVHRSRPQQIIRCFTTFNNKSKISMSILTATKLTSGDPPKQGWGCARPPCRARGGWRGGELQRFSSRLRWLRWLRAHVVSTGCHALLLGCS